MAAVLTLGFGAILLNALFVLWILELLPGIEIAGLWESIVIEVSLVIVTTVISALLALDDDAWYDRLAARQARKR